MGAGRSAAFDPSSLLSACDNDVQSLLHVQRLLKEPAGIRIVKIWNMTIAVLTMIANSSTEAYGRDRGTAEIGGLVPKELAAKSSGDTLQAELKSQKDIQEQAIDKAMEFHARNGELEERHTTKTIKVFSLGRMDAPCNLYSSSGEGSGNFGSNPGDEHVFLSGLVSNATSLKLDEGSEPLKEAEALDHCSLQAYTGAETWFISLSISCSLDFISLAISILLRIGVPGLVLLAPLDHWFGWGGPEVINMNDPRVAVFGFVLSDDFSFLRPVSVEGRLYQMFACTPIESQWQFDAIKSVGPLRRFLMKAAIFVTDITTIVNAGSLAPDEDVTLLSQWTAIRSKSREDAIRAIVPFLSRFGMGSSAESGLFYLLGCGREAMYVAYVCWTVKTVVYKAQEEEEEEEEEEKEALQVVAADDESDADADDCGSSDAEEKTRRKDQRLRQGLFDLKQQAEFKLEKDGTRPEHLVVEVGKAQGDQLRKVPHKVDSINHYTEQVAKLEADITEEFHRLTKESEKVGDSNCSNAFVTFSDRKHVEMAKELDFSPDEDEWVLL
ncbi:hypothetical protein AK812_SmicGene40219 [Symbiodinium microadriaticum]|uniref:Uncharacterized protein n=1 Tax=Symbiodinium microadriaticum TaxID=2951 RepID=A0A1Q9C985_SYMMI|nr:hypothetical protein AK812_SmicGene40219 [Symbiodinium microadriaticum]